MSRTIDLRSDTVSMPTAEMREAMANAEVGDDCYREDPSINRLEAMAAEITGKEAALFVTSGTQGNLVCLVAQCRNGDEFIVADESHIVTTEAGDFACVAGASPRIAPSDQGILTADSIRSVLRRSYDAFSPTRLICLENTNNRGGGAVYPLETLAGIRELADELDINVHMDGARVFNAAAALQVPVSEVVQYVDSVTFCLSKALSAPVGSIVCGTREFIETARRFRRMLGGGLRQSGVLAAAGIVALETIPQKLPQDHANARRLGEGLGSIPGITTDPEPTTNMVYIDIDPSIGTAAQLAEELAARDVKCGAVSDDRIRFVTYHQITSEDVETAIAVAQEAVAALADLRAPVRA
ncbi:MAG: beta-eliminating lyase-related protein [Chloroflexota bacterium]|nr:beta-eliminating lyase-related protein [Chloroflexota bacterium]MDE2930429.1 beta-eliminating lyase-related protein [Chloroflexota bacterium]